MGADSLFWCAQAVSAGESLGADVIKQKFPMPAKNLEAYRGALSKVEDKKGYYYSVMSEVEELLKLEPASLEEDSYELQVKRLNFVARCAPNSLKIISGGPKTKDSETLLTNLKAVMDSGNEGQIVGRNLWGRPIEESIDIAEQMNGLMKMPEYKRELKYTKP